MITLLQLDSNKDIVGWMYGNDKKDLEEKLLEVAKLSSDMEKVLQVVQECQEPFERPGKLKVGTYHLFNNENKITIMALIDS